MKYQGAMNGQTQLDAMFTAARQAMDRAYAPYSHFHVGACVRTDAGALYSGPNVENAAYPQGWCAECSAIAAMVAAGGLRIESVLVVGAPADAAGGYVDDPEALCTPCGGCRQKIREFALPETLIHVCGPEGLRRSFSLAELLPYDFGPDNLKR